MTRSAPRASLTFDAAIDQLAGLLGGDARRGIIEAAMAADTVAASFDRLRKAMRSHVFHGTPGDLNLRRLVDTLDARTQREGMHVLQGWDFVSHRFAKDSAPVLLLDYCERAGVPAGRERSALAILLDQYLLAVLSLLAIRCWDEGDANRNLDRVTSALQALQGPQGSGHQVVSDAETLLMLAVSYYHPEEHGYDLLVERVAALDTEHQLRFARAAAAFLGSHLRWGLRFMYQRDVGRMRADNVADYPLLTFAVLTLARALDGRREDGTIAQGLLDALSPDPWAFTDAKPPAALARQAEWHAEIRALLARHRERLASECARFQPSPRAFNPLAFACNFPPNAMVAMAVLAAQQGASPLPLNALFTEESNGATVGQSAHQLAQRLMAFAASDPNRLGAGGAPLIVYDPFEGAHFYNTAMRTIGTTA